MAYCDFCTCPTCTHGPSPEDDGWPHAPTDDGRWICDVCYGVEPCVCPPLWDWRALAPAGKDSVKMDDRQTVDDARKATSVRFQLHLDTSCPSRPALSGDFR